VQASVSLPVRAVRSSCVVKVDNGEFGESGCALRRFRGKRTWNAPPISPIRNHLVEEPPWGKPLSAMRPVILTPFFSHPSVVCVNSRVVVPTVTLAATSGPVVLVLHCVRATTCVLRREVVLYLPSPAA